jgi:hypothetical protein
MTTPTNNIININRGAGRPGIHLSNVRAAITEENPAIAPTDKSKLPLIKTIA